VAGAHAENARSLLIMELAKLQENNAQAALLRSRWNHRPLFWVKFAHHDAALLCHAHMHLREGPCSFFGGCKIRRRNFNYDLVGASLR
jgi:hypothetical protein